MTVSANKIIKYQEVLRVVVSTAHTMALTIPPSIEALLPADTLSIRLFVQFSIPVCTNRLSQPENYVSELSPTIEDPQNVLLIPCPPDNVVQSLQRIITSQNVRSIKLPFGDSQHYPLWIVSLWSNLACCHKVQGKWCRAVNSLEEQTRLHPGNSTLQQLSHSLSYIPWTGRLQGFSEAIDLQNLSAYLTSEWLTDEHELVMLEVLKQDLINGGCMPDHLIEDPAFALILELAYANRENYETHAYNWIRKHGEELASGTKRYLATIVNKDNVHWTAIILDFKEQTILHGDSFGHSIATHLHEVFSWWIGHHTGKQFTYRTLPIATQHDSFSCGMMAWDALRHHLLPQHHSLMDPQQAMVDRARMFLRLTKHYHKV